MMTCERRPREKDCAVVVVVAVGEMECEKHRAQALPGDGWPITARENLINTYGWTYGRMVRKNLSIT